MNAKRLVYKNGKWAECEGAALEKKIQTARRQINALIERESSAAGHEHVYPFGISPLLFSRTFPPSSGILADREIEAEIEREYPMTLAGWQQTTVERRRNPPAGFPKPP